MRLKLSVIILSYNVQHFLHLCLNSVQKAIADIDAEIIVIDNNSSDDSCRMVQQYFPEVKLLQNQENLGFAKANNQAAKHATGQYICILNPDTVVAEDTFVKLLEFCKNTTNLGAVGCKLVDGKGEFLPESKRNLPVIKVALNKQMGNDELYYANQVQTIETAKVPVLVGAFMFLERNVFDKMGGFDEDYFMYGEDIDLSYRLLNSGRDNFYFANTTVIHFKGESTSKNKEYARRFYGAMQIFYKKHFKTNWFDNALIGLGVKLASLMRKDTSKVDETVSSYLVVSNRQFTSLESVVVKPIKYVTQLSLVSPGTEIIFDAEFINYQNIITYMIDPTINYNATFKIIPPGTTFCVGSNSSKSQGRVIEF